MAVSSFPNGVRTFHVAGKIQASNVPRDMRLQRMLGHLTSLTAANPRSVLVIGCGAGITAGAVSIDPRVEHVTIVEIGAGSSGRIELLQCGEFRGGPTPRRSSCVSMMAGITFNDKRRSTRLPLTRWIPG